MSATPIVRSIAPKRILVVDDEPSVGQTMQVILSIDRHQVEVAGDGDTALAMFDAGWYDVVITEFRMAGMDGLELAQAIRARCPAQPVMLVTAHLEELARDNATLSNINNVLGKPFSVAQLREAVAALFPAG